MLVSFASMSANPPGIVGISSGSAVQSIFTLGAFGKKSSATYICPVSRLPLLSCARSPRSSTTRRRKRMCASPLRSAKALPAACSLADKRAMMRSGKNVTSTRGRIASVSGSKDRPTSVTSPAGRPSNVTGAPTDSPRSDSLK